MKNAINGDSNQHGILSRPFKIMNGQVFASYLAHKYWTKHIFKHKTEKEEILRTGNSSLH